MQYQSIDTFKLDLNNGSIDTLVLALPITTIMSCTTACIYTESPCTVYWEIFLLKVVRVTIIRIEKFCKLIEAFVKFF